MVRTAISLGLTAGLLVLGGAPAWADPSPGSSASADPGTTDPGQPTAAPSDEPTAEPTPEPTDVPSADPTEEPTEDPVADPTEEPTDDLVEGPDVVCGEPQGGGLDPCVIFAAGAGVPPGAVEKDTSPLGAGATELPRTGDETVLLALAGLGLVAVGAVSVLAGRPRRTA